MKIIYLVFAIILIAFSYIFTLKIKISQIPLDSSNTIETNQTIGDSNTTIINFNISGAIISHENMTVIPYLTGTVNITESQ